MKIHPSLKFPAATLLAAALWLSGADAREVSPEQARRAVGHWLQKDRQPLGAKMGASPRAPRTYRDTAGAPLFYVVQLDGGGFVVTSADDEIEPIIAFSDGGEFSADEDNPLWVLLHRDLPQRRDSSRARQFSPGGGLAGFTAAAHRQRGTALAKTPPAPEEQWAELAAAPAQLEALHVSTLSDMRVAPLVESQWGQSTVGGYAVYNYYTPTPPPYGPPNISASPNNSVAGCVATAGAQVMRYWKWPVATVASGTYLCRVNNTGAYLVMGGTAYNWNQMPPLSGQISTDTQRSSIGRLLYDVGVAVNMNYTRTSSSASTSDLAAALRSRFGYTSAVNSTYDLSANVSDYIQNMVLANLDAGAPVLIAISGAPGGHAIVGDGYGYNSGILYTHLNLGWNGSDNAWYNLPGIDATQNGYYFDLVTCIVYNIHPTDAGEIISGRVTNSSDAPLSGITVTISGGGGTRQAVTDRNGIYAARVPANASYTISASAEDSHASLTVHVGASNATTVGNRWGNNLRLQVNDQPLSVSLSGLSSVTAGAALTLNATVSGGVLPYTSYKWYDGADLKAATTVPAATLSFSAAGAHTVKVTVTDSAGATAESSRAITVYPVSASVSLAAALGTASTAGWTWSTSGNALWSGQTGLSHDGVSAARSGVIGNNQSTTVQTTVSGPGKIGFWWKVSSEENYDWLVFYLDGVVQTKISGEQNWTWCEFTVSDPGSHVLKWTYQKDASYAGGNDTAWLDEVSWSTITVAPLAVTPDLRAVPVTSSSFTVSVTSTIAWSAAADPWLHVTPASGSGNATLTVTCDDAGAYALAGRTGTLSFNSGAAAVTVVQTGSSVTLPVALDDNSRTWTTGGNLPWFAQTALSYSGSAAAQSGPVTHDQSTSLQTTVSGPGTVSFWWKVSSESGFDWLRFYIDGVEQTKISGEQDWALREFTINSAGSHTLEWEYSKDGSISRGHDAGWLDCVAWTGGAAATLSVTPESQNLTAAIQSFSLNITTNSAWTASANVSWLTLVRASGTGSAALSVICNSNTGVNSRDGTVTVSAGGDTRAVNITQAGKGGTLALSAALSTLLDWSTGGNGSWFGQTGVSRDGGAAQSGAIGNSQQTWLQTTVSGPGQLSFWWKVSSEADYDWLRFYIDGVEQAKISGEQPWLQRAYTLSDSGNHVLKWVYDKDYSTVAGRDTGWVDQVNWLPALPAEQKLAVTPASKSVTAGALTFSATVTANVAWTASSNAAWLTVSPASGTGSGALSVTCAANSGQSARAGTLTVSGSGLAGALAVTQAADSWDLAGLTGKGLKLSASIAVPKGVKLMKGAKAVYTWKRDGVTVASGSAKTYTAKIAGAYTLTLSYTTADGRTNTQTQTFGKLKLFAQPKTATLAMAQTTATITNSALRATSVVSGETLRLTASVGTIGGGAVGPFRYVWYSGGQVVRTQESAAATDTFVTPAYGDKTTGYKCVVELVARDAKNQPLAVAKSKELKAKIILPPSAVTLKLSASPVKEGAALTLTASAKGTATLSYVWYKNDRQIASSGAVKKFAKKPVSASDAGVYYVVVTQDKTTRRAQSAPLTVSVQRADGSIASGAQSQSAPITASPSAPASASSPAAAVSNSAAILNLAPLTLTAGDVLTVSGSATREYIIVSETQHTTGAYHYEWRDAITAEFQDPAAADAQLTLHFITISGGIYELTISNSVNETGAFELRKK